MGICRIDKGPTFHGMLMMCHVGIDTHFLQYKIKNGQERLHKIHATISSSKNETKYLVMRSKWVATLLTLNCNTINNNNIKWLTIFPFYTVVRSLQLCKCLNLQGINSGILNLYHICTVMPCDISLFLVWTGKQYLVLI